MSIAKPSFVLVSLIVVASMAIAGVGLSWLQSQEGTVQQPQAGKVLQSTKPASGVYVPGLPVRLIIPKISVSASIESLGLTVSGDLDAPKDIDNVGWYNSGPRAGSPGSAVMDGHFGIADGKHAVFEKLYTMQKGDLLYVKDSNSGVHTFIVRKTRFFQPDENASVVFRSNDNKAHLNLITCYGKWESSKQSYSARFVVFTDLVDK